MKKLIFALAFVMLLIGMIVFIPDTAHSQTPNPYLPPDSTTYIEPMWFGVYCEYPGAIPPNEGYIRIKWDETFPEGYEMDTVNPGWVTVDYPYAGWEHYPMDYSLHIVENGVSHWWGTTWNPPTHETAEINGYVRIKRIGGTSSTNAWVWPLNYHQYCPEAGTDSYLPLVMR